MTQKPIFEYRIKNKENKLTSATFNQQQPTKHEALGSMVTSPVINPTSENSSLNSRYFWLLRALIGEVYITLCLLRNDIAIAYEATTVFPAEVWADTYVKNKLTL